MSAVKCPRTPIKSKSMPRNLMLDLDENSIKSPIFANTALRSEFVPETPNDSDLSLDATVMASSLFGIMISPVTVKAKKSIWSIESPEIVSSPISGLKKSPDMRSVRRRMCFQDGSQGPSPTSEDIICNFQKKTSQSPAKRTSRVLIPLVSVSNDENRSPQSNWNPEKMHSSPEKIKSSDSQYEFIQIIGEGDYGQVWKAANHETSEIVAIKRSAQKIRSCSERNTWMREVKAVARLRPHPNLVRYFNTWQEDGYFNIAMELCAEGSLAEMIVRSCAAGVRMSVEDMARTAADVASGLAAMHEARLLHLDIKPDNLLLCGSVVKIGDFGLCVDEGKWDDQEGDSRYIAPELLQGVATGAADMFSLGLVLLQLALGLSDLPRNGPAWALLRSDDEAVCLALRSGDGDALLGNGALQGGRRKLGAADDEGSELVEVVLGLLRREHSARLSAADVGRILGLGPRPAGR